MNSTKPKSLLETEQKYTSFIGALLLACAISGVTTYLIAKHSVWEQWTVLSHLFTGILVTVALLPYMYTHLKRTLGFRRPGLLVSGFLSLALFLVFTLTGWHLLLEGQKENELWILNLHIGSSIVFVTVVVAHVISHIVFLPQKRRNRDKAKFPSINKGFVRYLLIVNTGIQLLVLLFTITYIKLDSPYQSTPVVENYEYSYGPHRFRPSQTETTNNAFIGTRQIANSERCLSCHEELGDQWISSVHSQAASDPTYVTNVSLLAEKKGIAATRYCEGCHAPVALLTGELSPGGKHGGIRGTKGNHEGISCMSCHGIDSLTHLKGVASYEFKPAEDYLFEKSENVFLTRINNLLIRVNPDQHKKDLAKPLLQESKYCSACHTQFMDKDMNNWGWVKMQDEYSAWLSSPYSRKHNEDFSNTTLTRCQDCHMPLVDSTDPSSDQNNKVRSHHFPGANTFLPLLRSDFRQFYATRNFLQSNKLRVHIDTPNRQDATQTLSSLDESLRSLEEAPYYYYIGEEAKINTIVSNLGVGHNFPAGTIDINEVWIEFLVMDAEGRSVYSKGLLDEEKAVDPFAYFYRSLPVDRNGKLVWKHDLFNMVGESFKRVIKAGKSDIVQNQFTIPAWVKSPLTITATLKYRKLNQRYAEWALGDHYIDIPVIDLAWDSLEIPVRIRKEVE